MQNTAETDFRDQLEQRRQRLVSARAHDQAGYLRELLGEVDEALARLDGGSFGLCEVCHDAVEDDRLAADPLVRFCLDCLSPAERTALEQDLELATHVQSALLPTRHDTGHGWETHYEYRPLGAVSGDHCDLIRPDASDDMFFLFGDISGKGVAASLLMAHLQAIFRGLVGHGFALTEVVSRANHLFSGNTPASAYATLVFGRLAPSGQLQICNAGHCPPLLRRNGKITPIEATGLPIGLFSGAPYTAQTFEMHRGDLLLLYTDGLSEARNGNTEYDVGRVETILTQGRQMSAHETTQACLEDVTKFRNGTPRSDDLTLMAIRRTGQDPSPV